jgi:hypothetical protein
MKSRKNKISTPGYFIKRLKDSGFVILRIFQDFKMSDPRKWVILLNPGQENIFITCYENKEFKGDIMFEVHDGGIRFPKNFFIKTDSLEVIVQQLIDKGVSTDPTTSTFFKDKNDHNNSTTVS